MPAGRKYSRKRTTTRRSTRAVRPKGSSIMSRFRKYRNVIKPKRPFRFKA